MIVSIERANIARVAQGKKDPTVTYFDILTPTSTFTASTRALTFDQLSKIALQPVKIDGVLSGRVYEGKQNLVFEQINIGK